MENSNLKRNVLIIDDHSVVRLGIKLLIDEVKNNVQFFEASNKETAFEVFKKVDDFDLIILDLNIPDYSCDGMIEYCKIKYPDAMLMVLSMNPESMMAKRYYDLGIHAYVNKGVNDDSIKSVLRELFSKRKYYSHEFLTQLANETFKKNEFSTNPFSRLSQREFEVAKLLIQGKSIQEISNTLSIQPSTIGTYKSRIFEKIEVANLIELYDLYNLYTNNSTVLKT